MSRMICRNKLFVAAVMIVWYGWKIPEPYPEEVPT
jgi:hypothetical protein